MTWQKTGLMALVVSHKHNHSKWHLLPLSILNLRLFFCNSRTHEFHLQNTCSHSSSRSRTHPGTTWIRCRTCDTCLSFPLQFTEGLPCSSHSCDGPPSWVKLKRTHPAFNLWLFACRMAWKIIPWDDLSLFRHQVAVVLGNHENYYNLTTTNTVPYIPGFDWISLMMPIIPLQAVSRHACDTIRICVLPCKPCMPLELCRSRLPSMPIASNFKTIR